MRSNKLLFSNKKSSFHIIPISNFSYFIKFKSQNIGINDNNESIIYNNIKNNDVRKYIWNIFNIRKNLYFIQNLYNNKIIEVSDNYIRLSNTLFQERIISPFFYSHETKFLSSYKFLYFKNYLFTIRYLIFK